MDNSGDETKGMARFEIMVEKVSVTMGGHKSNKKFLCLSNKQASLFTSSENMNRVLQALELPEAHFVIRLMPSFCGKVDGLAHEEIKGRVDSLMDAPPEINQEDLNRTEAQMLLFIKHCVLPVAMQTKALILVGGCNDDTLGMAVQKVMGPIQVRMGEACPFTIIGMCSANEVHAQALKGSTSCAGQYARRSKQWRRKFQDIHSIVLASVNNIEDHCQQCDINSVCSHVILFEGINQTIDKLDNKPRFNFENTFVECLVGKLPSIVIQSHRSGFGQSGALITPADVVRRKIPFLFLDPRERWPLLTPELNPVYFANPVTDLAKMTGAMEIPLVGPGGNIDCVAEVINRLTKHFQVLMEKGNNGRGSTESWTASTLAFCVGVSNMKKKDGRVSEDQRNMKLPVNETVEATEDSISSSSGFARIMAVELDDEEADEKLMADLFFGLVEKLDNQARIRMIECYLEQLEKNQTMTIEGDDFDEGSFENDSGSEFNGDSLFELQLKNSEVTREYKEELKSLLQKKKEIEDHEGNNVDRTNEEWLAVFDLLTSSNCFARSIYDLKGVSEIIDDVTKINSLPEKQTCCAVDADPQRIKLRITLSNLDVNATEVDLFYSTITSDDLPLVVERLKDMPNLVKLNLYGNQITSIESLSGLINLTELDLDSNQIKSIEPLGELVNLTKLDLNGNQINKESFNLFLTMRITLSTARAVILSQYSNTTCETLEFDYNNRNQKISWSTIAATINQAIERYPKQFSEKNKNSNLSLSIVCGLDPAQKEQHDLIEDHMDPNNRQAHLTTCQFIYHATSPTAKDNLDRDRRVIATSAINPLVREWAKTLGTYLNRYRIDEGPPIHKSATCHVHFAEDLLYENVQTYKTKNQQNTNTCTNNKRVALKIMKNHNEFTREITSRYGTDSEDLSDCTIGLIGWHIPDDESRVPDNRLRSVKERREKSIKQEYVLVMEMGSASLFLELVSQRIAGHDEIKIKKVFHTIVQRVQQLHSHSIIHSDIKPRNILRMPDDNIVLCDLDSALPTGSIRDASYKCSSAYCPPELAQFLFGNGTAPKVTDKFDVWSLGLILYELCTGQHLFSQDISDDNMTASADKTRLCLWNCISDHELLQVFDVAEAKNLIRWCLMGDPIQRPT